MAAVDGRSETKREDKVVTRGRHIRTHGSTGNRIIYHRCRDATPTRNGGDVSLATRPAFRAITVCVRARVCKTKTKKNQKRHTVPFRVPILEIAESRPSVNREHAVCFATRANERVRVRKSCARSRNSRLYSPLFRRRISKC